MTEPHPDDDRPVDARSPTPESQAGSAVRPLVVAVAGASGFVGRALLPGLMAAGHSVIGLSRRALGAPGDLARPEPGQVRWRQTDLFNLRSSEVALQGADVLVYLVHSMAPSARLTQARFEDTDLLLADNMARAAAKAGVRRIVYLGGLMPPVPEASLSRHLKSRLEVERALGGHGVPVTVLRAGLVVGPGGSSTEILVRLVQRLPVMLMPAWTAQPTRPVALRDVLEALAWCVSHARETTGEVFDVGGPDSFTYREMLTCTATTLNLRRPLFPVPFLTPRLSTAWVSMVTGQPRALVGPLVESLRHPMLPRDTRLQTLMGQKPMGFAESLLVSMGPEAPRPAAPAPGASAPGASAPGVSDDPQAPPRPKRPAQARDVRSVQRLKGVGMAAARAGQPIAPTDARAVANTYARWLRGALGLLRVERQGDTLRFALRGFGRRGLGAPLLVLTYQPERSEADRALYLITDGLLVRRAATQAARGRLEFRRVLDNQTFLAAIHDFHPRLPWPLYLVTQAQAHRLVMWAFGRHLTRHGAHWGPPQTP